MAERETHWVTRRCFVCRRMLEGAHTGDWVHDFTEPPGRAVVFTACGNDGSTVFDGPPDRVGFLEISVCDRCLHERSGAEGAVLNAFFDRNPNMKAHRVEDFRCPPPREDDDAGGTSGEESPPPT